MLYKCKQNLIGAVALITPFSYSLYYIFMSLLGLTPSSAGLRLFCAAICAIVLLLLISERYIEKQELQTFFFIGCFIGLMYVTRYFYGYVDGQYNGAILSFCVRAVPSMLIAILISRQNMIDYMIKWVQPFAIIYTIATFLASFSRDTSSLVYQSLSYYAMFAYGITVFLFLNRERMREEEIVSFKGMYMNIVYSVMMFMQIYSMLVGGGRGAFILFIVYTAVFLLYLVRDWKLAVYTILGIFVLYIIFKLSNISALFEQAGFLKGTERLLSFFSTTTNLQEDDRSHIYTIAYQIFQQSPIWGGGIGSVFYRLGSYSHNIFLDILIDAGILGLVVAIFIFARYFIRNLILIKVSWKYQLPLIMFLGSIVLLMFSSNYLLDGCMWFSGSLIFWVYRRRFV